MSRNTAKVQIKVNNLAVSDLEELKNNFALANINWNNNSHVKSGKAAPGSVGDFHIIIDPNDTDVSFRYDITFDFFL